MARRGECPPRKPSLKFKPSLSPLDERAVPNATSPTPPPGNQPAAASPSATTTIEPGAWVGLLNGTGDVVAWLTVGQDGGQWVVTGPSNNPTYTFVGIQDVSNLPPAPAGGAVTNAATPYPGAEPGVPPRNPPPPPPPVRPIAPPPPTYVDLGGVIIRYSGGRETMIVWGDANYAVWWDSSGVSFNSPDGLWTYVPPMR